MNLDELEKDLTPRFVRMVSREPKDGYFWNEYFLHYEEGDALFRARIIAAFEWRGPTHEGPTTAPPDDIKPRQNHVRDAVRANQ